MSNVEHVPAKADKAPGNESLANSMKSIKRKKMQREVYGDISKAAELVRLEASPVYNANGEVIQTTGGNLGEV